jgi:hypothetical protein
MTLSALLSAHASTSSPISHSIALIQILYKSPVKSSSSPTASPSTSGISPGDCGACSLPIRIPHAIPSCYPRPSGSRSRRCPSGGVGCQDGSRPSPASESLSPARIGGTILKGLVEYWVTSLRLASRRACGERSRCALSFDYSPPESRLLMHDTSGGKPRKPSQHHKYTHLSYLVFSPCFPSFVPRTLHIITWKRPLHFMYTIKSFAMVAQISLADDFL